jgi:membrane protein
MKIFENFFDKKHWEGTPNGQALFYGVCFIQKLVLKIKRDDCQGLASEMAYNLMMSLIPSLFFLFSLFGLIGKKTVLLPFTLKIMDRLAPFHAVDLLKEVLMSIVQSNSGKLTLFGLAISIWCAARTLSVLVKGMDRAYGIPIGKHSFWYSPLMSLLLTGSFGLMLVLSTYFIFWGDFLIQWIEYFFSIPVNLQVHLAIFQWFTTVLGMTCFTNFIYVLLSSSQGKRISWKTAFPGSVLFVASWIILSLLFGLYVRKMFHLNPIYGSIGAFILLMAWLYMLSLALLVGGEVISLSASSSISEKASD